MIDFIIIDLLNTISLYIRDYLATTYLLHLSQYRTSKSTVYPLYCNVIIIEIRSARHLYTAFIGRLYTI